MSRFIKDNKLYSFSHASSMNNSVVSLSGPNLESLYSKYPNLLTDVERHYPEEKRFPILRNRVALLLKEQSAKQGRQQQRGSPAQTQSQLEQGIQGEPNVPATPRPLSATPNHRVPIQQPVLQGSAMQQSYGPQQHQQHQQQQQSPIMQDMSQMNGQMEGQNQQVSPG